MTEATPTDPKAFVDSPDASIFGPKHITRVLVAALAVISCVIFAYVGKWIHWPTERGFRGSLALPPAPVALAVAVALLAVCTGIGTLILRQRFFLGGLLAATLGLTVWASRGGTMTYVLFYASNTETNQRVFLHLLGELIVLGGAIGGIWLALWHWRPETPLNLDEAKEGSRSTGAALLAQSAVMAIVILILVATPQKKQVLAGVFLAGLISTAIAEQVFANRSTARWYWVAPLAVGALGYVAAYLNPAGLEDGDLTGTFSGLARVLPLDYASLGMAGVLVGYWWMKPQEDDATEDQAETAPEPASGS